ncbi:MAG: S9 family peptidase [Bacteroidetes bacterium]|nr:S9 family peptidase [Bacteroidota bacterium]
MKILIRPLVLFAFVSALIPGCGKPDPVVTPKIPKEFVEFGQKRVDDYYWLNNPADSAVIRHLRMENAYTDAMLEHTAGLQTKLYDELVGRIDQEHQTLPIKRNGYWYYTRYEQGKQYPLYCRKKGELSSAEEVFLDVPRMAEGHQIFLVRGYRVSPDNQWVAYGIDTSGDRRPALRVKNLSTSEHVPDLIANTSGSYAWGADSKSLLYVLNDHTVRPYRVMLHEVGTDPAADRELFRETDSTFNVGLSVTRDNALIIITSGSTLSSECRTLPAERPAAVPAVVQPRRPDLLYQIVEHEGDLLYIHTNNDARNFKLVRTSLRAPGLAHWQDVIPHRPDALLENVEVLAGYLVAQQRIRGLTQIQIADRLTGESTYAAFDEPAYEAELGTATDAHDLDSIRIEYTSLTTPRSFYRYDLRTHERSLLKRDKVGGGFDGALYRTERLWISSEDSVQVPVSLVYKSSLFARDGTNPMLLYAYGSYGSSTAPSFNSSVISLLDRGFVFGIAHVRGGQEMGREWYENGKVLKKKNTFIDFVACAQSLVDRKYTSANRLFANGGSAGGMLMGAIVNMRPDLFRGILADVPWMDVITDMQNPDLPLTTLEYDEWGNPGIEEHYRYMLTWSPYDNVRDARYPAIFATAGLNDTQVPYFSPAKWVAKVREHNTGENPVLLKVNMGAGHSGESGRFERQRLTAMKYAFMLDVLGRKD